MERWGGGNGRRRKTNARPLVVFMAALIGRFNPQREWWSNGARRAQEGEGWPWRLGRRSGTSLAAAGLGLAARPEEDEGGRAPVVRERRGGGAGPVGQGLGWWAGWFGPAGRPRPKKWVGRLGWKRKEKGNPLKIDF
jgi:hypothetical protein